MQGRTMNSKTLVITCLLIAGILPQALADHVGIKITSRPTISLVVGRIASLSGAMDPVADTVKEVNFTPTAADVINQIAITSADVVLVEVGFRKATADTSMTVSLTYTADAELINTNPSVTATIPMSNITWTVAATGKNHVQTLNLGGTAIGASGELANYTSTVNPAVWLGGELMFTYNPSAIYPEGTYQGKIIFKTTAQVP